MMNELRLTEMNILAESATVLFRHGERQEISAAFEKGGRCAVDMYLPRGMGVVRVSLEIFAESGGKLLRRVPAVWEGMTDACDLYVADVSDLHPGLYYFRLAADTPIGTVYGTGEGVDFPLSRDASPRAQLSVSEFAYPVPHGVAGGILYHVFVDRFFRGSREVPCKPGAVINPDWDGGVPQFAPYPGAPLANNMFFGGRLFGVCEKLDYLVTLGVTLIYLSPVFDSPSNHKYDTGDYKTVDAMFGGEEALTFLIREAGKRGIGILLDGVFNHTGADSLYFNRYGNYPGVGAYQSKSSPYYDWYEFQHYPDKYTCWWDIEILPRIHPDKKNCRDFFTGPAGVIRQYAAMGIAGFRLDVADELSDAFLMKIKATLEKEHPGSILYGEVWEDASDKIAYGVRKKYYLGKELDGVMNYPLREGLVDYFVHGDTEKLRYALTTILNHAPKRIRDRQMNLLGTHDTERILTVLGGKPRGTRTNAELSRARMTQQERACGIRRLKMAYTVLATLPGIPAIYYGDEAGLEGYQDPFNRMPFPWGREDAALLEYYRATGDIRRHARIYATGDFCLLRLTKEQLLFARFDARTAYLASVNRSDEDVTLSFSGPVKEVYSGKRVHRYIQAPGTAVIFRMPTDTEILFEDTN